MIIDFTVVVQTIVTLIAALVTTFFIPWLKSKTSENSWNLLTAVVKSAVLAAEQIYGNGRGEEKKQYVLDYLSENGVSIDDAVIEGTVNEYFGKTGAKALEFSEVE